MFYQTWGRAVAVVAVLCVPLMGGDYDHVFDVAKEVWPERTMAMAFCNKDANEMALIELADSAKAHNLSLMIVDLRDEKEYNRTVASALSRNPGMVLIIDDDALLGAKGHLTARLIYRVQGKDIPVVGISKDLIKLGAVLATGSGAGDPVYAAKALAKKMNLALPEKTVEVPAK